MAKKHLHEFLEHVQDPFLLNNYIADRRSKLKPSKRSAAAAVLGDLHIPSPTAALLLEAALRIFHDQPAISPTPKFQIPGLFGTLFTNLFICRNREHNTTTSTVRSSSSMSDHHHYHVQPDEEGETEDQTSPKRRVPFCLSICKGATFNRLSPPLPPATPIRRRQEFFNGVQIHLEEEKELGSSPVSVLEPDPFKEDEDDEATQSLYCWNGEITDSKKQKLLDKLKRFERLDPRELDKTLVLSLYEQQEEDIVDRCDDEFEVMDVIVDFEMGREVDDGWNDSEQVAIEIEVSIYGDLVHELLVF